MSKTKTPEAKPAKKTSAPKPKTPKPAPKPAKPTTIEVTIDHALKAEWKARLATLEHAKREGASQFDVQWETVGAIVEHDPPLYLAGEVPVERDGKTTLVPLESANVADIKAATRKIVPPRRRPPRRRRLRW